MAKKMTERKDLKPDTMLTVKEAANLTNLSVPAFYTNRNKQLLGFNSKSDGVWLISAGSLVENGFLTPEFDAVRTERMYSEPRQANGELELLEGRIEELEARIEFLHGELERVMDEKRAVQQLADERAKQIEMIDALLVASGLKKIG